MKANIFLAAVLLSLMPYTADAQGTDINSRDLRGEVVYQDDEVVFRQLDEHTWIGNGHRCYNESLYLVEGNIMDSVAMLSDRPTCWYSRTFRPKCTQPRGLRTI
jgi:hypothetical protein